MRGGLEDVRPHAVEEMVERVLASEPEHTQGHVADGGRRDLAMNKVTFHEGVFEKGNHRVDVVLAHFADVLEEKGERLGMESLWFSRSSRV